VDLAQRQVVCAKLCTGVAEGGYVSDDLLVVTMRPHDETDENRFSFSCLDGVDVSQIHPVSRL